MRKPKIVERLAYKTIGDETIILDTRINQQVHQLNELASFIWNLCDGEHDVDEITEKVCLEFEISKDTASKDVLEFLIELQDKMLLKDGTYGA